MLLVTPTLTPPVPAAVLNVIVQLDVPGAFTVAGVHVSPEGTAPTEIAPVDEVGEAAIELPPPELATNPVITSEIGLADGLEAIVNVATAIVPFPIPVVFMPSSKQVDPAQNRDFPAVLPTVPITTEIPVILEFALKDH